METAKYYKGIKIELVFGDYEFMGYFDNELIKGYSDSEEKAKKIIDESINYIIQYQEREISNNYIDMSFSKMSSRRTSYDYDY